MLTIIAIFSLILSYSSASIFVKPRGSSIRVIHGAPSIKVITTDGLNFQNETEFQDRWITKTSLTIHQQEGAFVRVITTDESKIQDETKFQNGWTTSLRYSVTDEMITKLNDNDSGEEFVLIFWAWARIMGYSIDQNELFVHVHDIPSDFDSSLILRTFYMVGMSYKQTLIHVINDNRWHNMKQKLHIIKSTYIVKDKNGTVLYIVPNQIRVRSENHINFIMHCDVIL